MLGDVWAARWQKVADRKALMADIHTEQFHVPPEVSKVFVEPIGVTLEVGQDETLWMPSSGGRRRAELCAGRGTCGKCLVRLGAGELSRAHRGRGSQAARAARGRAGGSPARPAAYPPGSASRYARPAATGASSTTSRLRHGAVHPAVTRATEQLDPPMIGDARSDLERVQAVLHGVEVPYQALREAPDVLRGNGWRATFTGTGGA